MHLDSYTWIMANNTVYFFISLCIDFMDYMGHFTRWIVQMIQLCMDYMNVCAHGLGLITYGMHLGDFVEFGIIVSYNLTI